MTTADSNSTWCCMKINKGHLSHYVFKSLCLAVVLCSGRWTHSGVLRSVFRRRRSIEFNTFACLTVLLRSIESCDCFLSFWTPASSAVNLSINYKSVYLALSSHLTAHTERCGWASDCISSPRRTLGGGLQCFVATCAEARHTEWGRTGTGEDGCEQFLLLDRWHKENSYWSGWLYSANQLIVFGS